MNDTVVSLFQTFWKEDDSVFPIIADALEEVGDDRAALIRDLKMPVWGEVSDEEKLIYMECPVDGIERAKYVSAVRDELWHILINLVFPELGEAYRLNNLPPEPKPKPDSRIEPDEWGFGSRLKEAPPGDLAPFRLPSTRYADIEYPVYVFVTGKSVRRRRSGYYLRVRIEFVGDGEPSTFSGGWMEVGSDCVY
jgi:hypothetical protein